MNAFYRAAELDRPMYPPFLRTIVKGSPIYNDALGFLFAMVSSGLAGPKTWWLGAVRVESVSGRVTHLEACSFDAGTHYRSNGRPGPSDLGGGADYTSYQSVLELLHGSWELFESVAHEAAGTSGGGPCHGL